MLCGQAERRGVQLGRQADGDSKARGPPCNIGAQRVAAQQALALTSPPPLRLSWIGSPVPLATSAAAACSPAQRARNQHSAMRALPTRAWRGSATQDKQPASLPKAAQAIMASHPFSPVSPSPTNVPASSRNGAALTSCSSVATAPHASQAATPATTSKSTASAPHLAQMLTDSIAGTQAGCCTGRRGVQAGVRAAAARGGGSLAHRLRLKRPLRAI